MAADWVAARASSEPTHDDETVMDGAPGFWGSTSSDQRPAVVRVGRLAAVSAVAGLRRGSIRARSWSKPSAEARPAGGRSQRARARCWRGGAGGGLRAGEAGEPLEVGGEAGPAPGEKRADCEGLGRESGSEELLVDGLLGEGVGQPVGGLADVEGDGRGVGRDDAAGGGSIANSPGGVRRDGFHLLASGCEGEAVDALEDAALAPFDFVVFTGRRMFECAAHQQSLHLHGEKGLENGGGREGEAISEGAGGDGAGNL